MLSFIKSKIRTKDAAEFLGISSRNALEALKKLVNIGVIKKVGTATKDPLGGYVLAIDSE